MMHINDLFLFAPKLVKKAHKLIILISQPVANADCQK